MTDYGVSLSFDKEEIGFDLFYVQRKTMEIAVYPDCRIVVKAPVGTAPYEVKSRLSKHMRWIQKQLDYFHQFDPRNTRRYYIGGETHLYLGHQYRLKIQKGESSEVKLKNGLLYITHRDGDSASSVKRLLGRWYLTKAREKFAESYARCAPKFNTKGEELPKLQIRRMKTRWGSLSHGRVLTLNVDLIRAPKDCIDYVITHELCHLLCRKHAREFYGVLEEIMPDWKVRKSRLEMILNEQTQCSPIVDRFSKRQGVVRRSEI